MSEWCWKCGTYHERNTAGRCPGILEDKLFVGTYAEGHDAGYRAGVEAGKAERDELRRHRKWALKEAIGWRNIAHHATDATFSEYQQMKIDECSAIERSEAAEAERDKLVEQVWELEGALRPYIREHAKIFGPYLHCECGFCKNARAALGEKDAKV